MNTQELASIIAVPRYFPGEEEAIKIVTSMGDAYGFGNLISRLKDAWSLRLQENHGMSKKAADAAACHVCPWCQVDSRTGKKLRS